MLDINEIENTIEELENKSTTFDTCMKLASLYLVIDHYKERHNNYGVGGDVLDIQSEEHQDLLPSYSKYCELKGKYQIGELSSTFMLTSLSALCLDMQKFVLTLYSTTDCEEERQLISETLNSITKRIETSK